MHIRISSWLALGACVGGVAIPRTAQAEGPHSPGIRSEPFSPGAAAPVRGSASSPARLQADGSVQGLFGLIAFGGGPSGAGAPAATKAVQTRHGAALDCRAHCTDGQIVGNRALSTASTVLASVTGAAVAAGIVLRLTATPGAEHAVLAPALRVKLSGQRALLSVVWRF